MESVIKTTPLGFKKGDLLLLKKYGDIIIALTYMIFAIILFIASFSISAFVTETLGPAFMPRFMSIILFVLGAVLLSRGIVQSKQTETKKEEKTENIPIRLICTSFLIFLYVALLNKIGFLCMTAVYLFVQELLLTGPEEINRRNIGISLAVAMIAAPVLYFLFQKVFNIFLPIGIWG